MARILINPNRIDNQLKPIIGNNIFDYIVIVFS